MNLKDHIHQQSNSKKASSSPQVIASSTPNSHNQIIEGGIKQKAYKKKQSTFSSIISTYFHYPGTSTAQKPSKINTYKLKLHPLKPQLAILIQLQQHPTCQACGRAYYQTPILEGAPLLALAKTLPSFAVAHFRHLKAHWPETDLSIKL